MLNVGVVGIGNAGSQVAELAMTKLGINVLAINSSEKDLQTISSKVPHRLIGDARGAGKERTAAKQFLKDSIMEIIQDKELSNLFDVDVLFVISSTGGGTGSGAAIMFSEIMNGFLEDTKIITVGILPTLKEALSTQLNTIEYMKELYGSLGDATYMLYDNDKLSKLPSTIMMQTINQSIVDDIDVIRGTYQLPTKFSSIDEKDMSKIINTIGRIAIASLKDIKEKDIDEVTIEDLIIKEFKTNSHCELQRDKIVERTGVIVDISDRINEKFDSHIPVIQEFIGVPLEEYEHITINSDRHLPNNIFLIASGLTQVNDRIRKINDRIEEINERQNQHEEDSELNGIDFDNLSNKIKESSVERKNRENIDLKNIFKKFNV